ncbi:MAG: hypothetical protein JKX72_07260 [Robiginitomaculum sp.]|nr:hypothetical protein [Robiginitomaculum sp.]
MKNIFKACLSVMMVWCFAFIANASESVPIKSGKAISQLVTSHDRALPGSDIHIALSQRLEPHWHTYWRNAGGPGKPVQINRTLPSGASVGDILWPLPTIIHTVSIVNYVFEDKLLLPMVLHVPDDAKLGETLEINATALYLVCYQVCLPESAELSLTLEIGAPLLDGRWGANIRRTLAGIPQQNTHIRAAIHKDGDGFVLGIQAENLNVESVRNPYFFPYIQDMIDADAPQTTSQFEHGFSLGLNPGWKLERGWSGDMVGVISYEVQTDTGWKRQGSIVTAKTGAVLDLGKAVKAKKYAQFSWSWMSLLAIFLACLAIGGFVAKRRKK